jgi:hypothetical protein
MQTPTSYRGRVITDPRGQIVEACDAAALALNFSARALTSRPLLRFFPSNHTELMWQIEVASRGHDVELDAMLHPRDRRPKRALARITAFIDRGLIELLWSIDLTPREGPPFRVASCAT